MDAGAGEVSHAPASNLSPLTPLPEAGRGEPDTDRMSDCVKYHNLPEVPQVSWTRS
jgi:hypothetical protein